MRTLRVREIFVISIVPHSPSWTTNSSLFPGWMMMSDIGLCQTMLSKKSLFYSMAHHHHLRWFKLHLSLQLVYLSGALSTHWTSFSLSHILLVIHTSGSGTLSPLHSPTAPAYPRRASRIAIPCRVLYFTLWWRLFQHNKPALSGTIPFNRKDCYANIIHDHTSYPPIRLLRGTCSKAKVYTILSVVEPHTFWYIPSWSIWVRFCQWMEDMASNT